jgi:hypothetical protein
MVACQDASAVWLTVTSQPLSTSSEIIRPFGIGVSSALLERLSG